MSKSKTNPEGPFRVRPIARTLKLSEPFSKKDLLSENQNVLAGPRDRILKVTPDTIGYRKISKNLGVAELQRLARDAFQISSRPSKEALINEIILTWTERYPDDLVSLEGISLVRSDFYDPKLL